MPQSALRRFWSIALTVRRRNALRLLRPWATGLLAGFGAPSCGLAGNIRAHQAVHSRGTSGGAFQYGRNTMFRTAFLSGLCIAALTTTFTIAQNRGDLRDPASFSSIGDKKERSRALF